jgi:hypothetical protein
MKKIILSILFVLGVICSSLLFYYKLHTYSIVAITVTAILLICLICSLFADRTPEDIYNKNLRDLIKTYEPILVDIDKLPEFDVKNIIKVSTFEKMVDVQYELKKPIFYKMSLNTCSFILMDSDIAYVYILRVNEDSFSPLDDIMASIEMSAKKRRKDKKILEDIDKTTIIVLDDFKEYKVSPVRKSDVTKLEDITIIDEEKEEKEKQEEKKSFFKRNKGKVTDRSRKWRLSQLKKNNKE